MLLEIESGIYDWIEKRIYSDSTSARWEVGNLQHPQNWIKRPYLDLLNVTPADLQMSLIYLNGFPDLEVDNKNKLELIDDSTISAEEPLPLKSTESISKKAYAALFREMNSQPRA